MMQSIALLTDVCPAQAAEDSEYVLIEADGDEDIDIDDDEYDYCDDVGVQGMEDDSQQSPPQLNLNHQDETLEFMEADELAAILGIVWHGTGGAAENPALLPPSGSTTVLLQTTVVPSDRGPVDYADDEDDDVSIVSSTAFAYEDMRMRSVSRLCNKKRRKQKKLQRTKKSTAAATAAAAFSGMALTASTSRGTHSFGSNHHPMMALSRTKKKQIAPTNLSTPVDYARRSIQRYKEDVGRGLKAR
jgi:hypothetical protein